MSVRSCWFLFEIEKIKAKDKTLPIRLVLQKLVG
jgi:hypothetical protein